MVLCHWITEITAILGSEYVLTLALLERTKCGICFMESFGFLLLRFCIVITLTWLSVALGRRITIGAAPIRWIKIKIHVQKVVQKHI